jgi:hypothetical protein
MYDLYINIIYKKDLKSIILCLFSSNNITEIFLNWSLVNILELMKFKRLYKIKLH